MELVKEKNGDKAFGAEEGRLGKKEDNQGCFEKKMIDHSHSVVTLCSLY